MTRLFSACGLAAVAAMLLLASAALAQDKPRSFTFDGHTLTEYRAGADEEIAFSQFGREERNMREMFAIRSIKKRVLKDELDALVSAILAAHPSLPLRMIERSGGSDVMMSYQLTPDKGDPTLVLWRLVQNGSLLIAAVYQLDFGINNEEAKAKVDTHAAELALSKIDPSELKRLVARTAR